MSVNIQTGNVVKIQSGNRVLISAPGPQGPAGPNGTPGGTDTQVQFNDSSAFGGDAGLTYNKTTDTLSATNLTVSGVSTLNHIHGSIAGNLYVHVKNTTAGTLAKGTPVYATGSVGASGEIEVAAADYTNSAKMPAIGILDAELGVNAEGNAVVVGEVMGLATNSYAINQELFVGTNGLLGALPATGQAQSIAVVSRAHASTGIIVVNAQARLNAALTALANNNGASLTGITAAQVGAVANGDSPTFDEVTLTNGIINSQFGAIYYDFYDVVDSTAVPYISARLYDDQDPPQIIGNALFGFRGDGAGSGYQFLQGSTNNFTFEGVGNVGLADVTANSFIGSGASLTGLDAGSITTGTLGVANGGTGATTLTSNNVLLGNGTSALLEVAPGTTGNVLTSDGTTWTSTAPTTGANPAGSGSELQFRSSGTAFGAVTNSSVSGGTLTLGNAEALGTTPTAYLTLRNTTAATVGVPAQVSPSIVLEGQGWKTTATAASQTVRFRENVLPVQGTTNPSATWRLQSEINNSGTWTDTLQAQPGGNLYLGSGGGSLQLGTNLNATSIGIHSAGILFSVSSAFSTKITTTEFRLPANQALVWTGTDNNAFSGTTEVSLIRDAAQTLAQRNGTNAQSYRLYGTFTTATNYQRMTVRSVKTTLSALSDASATTTGTFIPDGAVVVGVTTRVATAITGATGYQVGDGTDADRWGDINAIALNTTSDNANWTAGTIECFTSGGEVTLTANTNNFTAGAVEICVFYLAGEAD